MRTQKPIEIPSIYDPPLLAEVKARLSAITEEIAEMNEAIAGMSDSHAIELAKRRLAGLSSRRAVVQRELWAERLKDLKPRLNQTERKIERDMLEMDEAHAALLRAEIARIEAQLSNPR